MATDSCILAWRIPWTERPGRLQFITLQRVKQLRLSKHACTPKGHQKSIFNVWVYVSVFMPWYFSIFFFFTLNPFSYLSWLLQFNRHTHTHTHTHTHMCKLNHFSHVRLFANLWATACQAPLPMGFSRHKYWNELSCPPPRDILNPGIEPVSLMFACTNCHLRSPYTIYTKWNFRFAVKLNKIYWEFSYILRSPPTRLLPINIPQYRDIFVTISKLTLLPKVDNLHYD